MSGFFLILLLLLDFGICWWDAVVAGQIWVEAKSLGGFMRAVAWSAAIQSAFGFTMIFGVILGYIAYAFGVLNAKMLGVLLDADYLLVILPILGSGFIITIYSWIVAYRERSLTNMSVATYNTFAMSYDTFNAIDGIGNAFSAVLSGIGSDSKSSSSDDDSNGMVVIAGLLLLVALGCGIMLTAGIIRHYAGTLRLPKAPDRSYGRTPGSYARRA